MIVTCRTHGISFDDMDGECPACKAEREKNIRTTVHVFAEDGPVKIVWMDGDGMTMKEHFVSSNSEVR